MEPGQTVSLKRLGVSWIALLVMSAERRRAERQQLRVTDVQRQCVAKAQLAEEPADGAALVPLDGGSQLAPAPGVEAILGDTLSDEMLTDGLGALLAEVVVVLHGGLDEFFMRDGLERLRHVR